MHVRVCVCARACVRVCCVCASVFAYIGMYLLRMLFMTHAQTQADCSYQHNFSIIGTLKQ